MLRLGLFFIVLLAAAPIALASVTVDPGFQIGAGGGSLQFSQATDFDDVTVTAATATVTIPLRGYPYISIGAESGQNVTVTAIDTYDLKFTTAQSGVKSTTVKTPGKPQPRVLGGTPTYSGDTTTIDTLGASSVAVHYAMASGEVTASSRTMFDLLPIIVMLALAGIMKFPSRWLAIVQVAFIFALMAILGGVFFGWGF